MERWKDVLRFEGFYRVSDKGRIKSVTRSVFGKNGSRRKVVGRIKRPNKMKDGRLMVQLWKNNESEAFYVHRLVLEAFIGPCPEGMECCHFPDPDQTNCHLNNLRWDTSKANKKDSRILGRWPIGEKKPKAKIKDSDVPNILRRLANGEGNTQIATDYGVSQSIISDIRRGKTRGFVKCPERAKVKRGIPGIVKGSISKGKSKLTMQQAEEIRITYSQRKATQESLAAKYGVCRMTIFRVLDNQTYHA